MYKYYVFFRVWKKGRGLWKNTRKGKIFKVRWFSKNLEPRNAEWIGVRSMLLRKREGKNEREELYDSYKSKLFENYTYTDTKKNIKTRMSTSIKGKLWNKPTYKRTLTHDPCIVEELNNQNIIHKSQSNCMSICWKTSWYMIIYFVHFWTYLHF